MEKGLPVSISFSYNSDSASDAAFMIRNENLTLCYVLRGRVTIIDPKFAWNSTYNCSYLAANFSLCIKDVQFSGAGLFSLKVSSILVKNVTLQVEGKSA